MPKDTGADGAERPQIQWGDLAVTVAVTGFVVALMLTPMARRFWLPESAKNPQSGA